MLISQESYSHFHLFLALFALFLVVLHTRIVNEEFGTKPWVRFQKSFSTSNKLFYIWRLDFNCHFVGHSYFAHHFPRLVLLKTFHFSKISYFINYVSWLSQALSNLCQLVLWCWIWFWMGCIMFECELQTICYKL